MKGSEVVDKRKFKRLDLSIPMTLKRISSDGKENTVTGLTSNISYNGTYVREANIKDLKPEENLHISLSVPRDDTRDFPFSRLTGKARVVRVEKDAVALEFNENMSRLFVAN